MISEKQQSSVPSNTEPNPKAHVNAIILRSDEETKDEVQPQSSGSTAQVKAPVKVPVREYKPRIPYPNRLLKEKMQEQYGKFLELFKQLHINIPFVEALLQMPKYAKFLKDVLTNKKKLEELSTATLNGECSAVITDKLPRKMNDPGSFTIPCLIGNLSVNNALADLGASINLMPYSLFAKLDLGEPKPVKMNIQLADRSIKYPRGIVENILVKVKNFIFPVDFVILDMDEDKTVPIILGRPFLATARSLIDAGSGKLTLRVGEEEVTFENTNSMSNSANKNDSLYSINHVNSHLEDQLQEIQEKGPLDACLLEREDIGSCHEQIVDYLEYLLANGLPSSPNEEDSIESGSECKLESSTEESVTLEAMKYPSQPEYIFWEGEEKKNIFRAIEANKHEKDWITSLVQGKSSFYNSHETISVGNDIPVTYY